MKSMKNDPTLSDSPGTCTLTITITKWFSSDLYFDYYNHKVILQWLVLWLLQSQSDSPVTCDLTNTITKWFSCDLRFDYCNHKMILHWLVIWLLQSQSDSIVTCALTYPHTALLVLQYHTVRIRSDHRMLVSYNCEHWTDVEHWSSHEVPAV